METHYEILEVARSASIEAIKGAYRFLSQKYGIEGTQGSLEAARKWQRLNDAYAVLSDPVKRRQYDERLAEEEEMSRRDRQVKPDVMAHNSPAGPSQFSVYCTSPECPRLEARLHPSLGRHRERQARMEFAVTESIGLHQVFRFRCPFCPTTRLFLVDGREVDEPNSDQRMAADGHAWLYKHLQGRQERERAECEQAQRDPEFAARLRGRAIRQWSAIVLGFVFLFGLLVAIGWR